MLNRNEHDNLVGRLYASALGDASWAGIAQHIAEVFGTSGSLIQLHHPQHVVTLGGHPHSESFAREYCASDIYRDDPRMKFFAKVPPATVYFDHALFDVEEMNRDPRCRAANDVVGTKYSLGTTAPLLGGVTGYVALMSGEVEGHASQSAIRAFRRLAPHIAHAFSLGQILEQRAATQVALLDALASKADGVILLGLGGVPVFLNDAARDILAARDGLSFSGGVFVTRKGAETRKLQGAVRDAISAARPSEAKPGGQMLISRPSGKHPYVVRVMGAPRMERFLSGLSIACVVHLHDLAAIRLPSKDVLCAIFGLGEREAEFAVALVRCANLGAAAASCGMAINTARNHMQSIFRKSGTNSQTEAVQLFTRMA